MASVGEEREQSWSARKCLRSHPKCKKRRGKKEPPLWTVDQGLLLGGRSQAELQGAGKQGSEGGVCEAKGVCGVKGVCEV